MKRSVKKTLARKRRHRRVRGRISGRPERPRLVVCRSNKQIGAQVIDDVAGRTICSISSLTLGRAKALGDGKGCNVAGASVVGTALAKVALDKGVKKVAFDRAGYRYHGRVKAFADAAREAGLEC